MMRFTTDKSREFMATINGKRYVECLPSDVFMDLKMRLMTYVAMLVEERPGFQQIEDPDTADEALVAATMIIGELFIDDLSSEPEEVDVDGIARQALDTVEQALL